MPIEALPYNILATYDFKSLVKCRKKIILLTHLKWSVCCLFDPDLPFGKCTLFILPVLLSSKISISRGKPIRLRESCFRNYERKRRRNHNQPDIKHNQNQCHHSRTVCFFRLRISFSQSFTNTSSASASWWITLRRCCLFYYYL